MNWTDLRKQLAQRAGVNEKEAGAFWSAFNSQLVEALKQDKQVKINGLGTFKLQAVAPRKSVNVKTGEAMTIEGYNKIVFSPEAGMKELVESRGERLKVKGERKAAKAEPEIDPLKKLGEQANEIVDILSELGQAPEKGKKGKGERLKVKGERKKKAQKPVEPVVEPEPVVEEPKIVAAPEPIVEEPKVVVAPEPIVEKPKKKYHFLRDTLICVVCLLMVLLIGYFFLRSQLSTWIESLVQPAPEQTEMVTAPTAEEPVVIEPSAISDQPSEEPMVEEPQPIEESQPIAEEPAKTEPAKAKPAKHASLPTEAYHNGYEILTVEEMHQDSRLAWMSKRYYGEKKFWVYIYDANKEEIPNPCRIAVGTPIRVPKLTKAQMDTTLTETRENLERLTIEAEVACWTN